VGQRPQHRAHLGELGAAAAQLGGHRGGEDAAPPQVSVVLGDERVVGIVTGGPSREGRD
jgi:hypothetical protein